MPKLASKNQCTGCSACVSVCPKQCIYMKRDVEGFVYPKIKNDSLCISCGVCERVCPVLNQNNHDKVLTKAYAAFSKNEQLRMESSSGGVFSEIAKIILQENGIVYGASYNENGIVQHIYIDDIKGIKKIRGAKYSQSDMNNSFQVIKSQLISGRKVLFSGTPCQVAGLKSFLEKDFDNLFCIDFVCHGVPSPMVWEQYLKYRRSIDKSSKVPEYINLRNKESGWSRYSYSVEFIYSNKTRYFCSNQNDPFMRLFVDNYILRKSCSNCQFKGYSRVSDITLGDFWGIWDISSSMDDNKGTSLVLIHNVKGEKMFRAISSNIKSSQVTLEQASMMNPSLLQSAIPQPGRDKVLSGIIQNGFETIIPIFQSKESVKNVLSIKIRKFFCHIKNRVSDVRNNVK